MLSGDRPASGGQPAPVGAVRCPAALRRLPRPSLGRAGDRPRAGHRRARRRRPGAPLDPDRWQHGDRCARLRRRLRRAARAVRRGWRVAAAIVFTSSSGGTHAGLVAGRLLRARPDRPYPPCWRSASPRASSRHPRRRRAGRRGAGPARRRPARRSATTTSRSTTAGSATTTPCRPAPATRRSAGRRATAAGCSIARTPARASPACSATPGGPLGPRRRRRVHPHRRPARRVRGPGRGAPVASVHLESRAGPMRDRWRGFGWRRRRVAVVRSSTSTCWRSRTWRQQPAPGGRRRRAAQPRDRVRAHPPRPVRGPARHRLRLAAAVLRRDAGREAALVVPGAHGQTGYTGLLVETAASSDSPTGRRCSTGRRRSRRATR